jgi:hypothetical protein
VAREAGPSECGRGGALQRNIRPCIGALLAALLALPISASASRPGYSHPTRQLEAAFKIALHERVASADGCYPSPAALATAIRRGANPRTRVATHLRSVRRTEIVYVLRHGTSCGGVRLAFRYKRGVFILNSKQGTVVKKGRHRGGTPGRVGRLRDLTVATRTFRLTTTDHAQRLTVRCPHGTSPLGGGMTTTPGAGVGGEAVYPHSYERLGAQQGWHISAILLDRRPGDTTPRTVSVQVVCGRGLAPAKPMPHATVFVRPGETGTATAHCPEHQYLFSGGFQRTDFAGSGGDYVTESRAIGARAWRVSGSAFGGFGGELTAIAYCVRTDRPLVGEVSASVPVAAGLPAVATTPPCPPGRRLSAGGFSANGSQEALFAGGSFNRDGSWSVAGYGYFGSPAQLTAYGYCIGSHG